MGGMGLGFWIGVCGVMMIMGFDKIEIYDFSSIWYASDF